MLFSPVNGPLIAMAEPLEIRLSQVKVALPGGRTLFSLRELFIAPGSKTLIRGASGSGKTSLLHLIAGLYAPLEGQVEIGGVRLASLSENERCEFRRAKIGVIFQKLNLIDHLTVRENVSLCVPLMARGSQEARAAEARVLTSIEKVNLKGRERTRCSRLSLGEQQRVAVARVLAQEPQLILADEPTSSLDDQPGRFVIQALKEAARARTLVVVSHDHRLEKEFDRVIRFEELAR
jgi:putative ABC transport system ATP-binding protein